MSVTRVARVVLAISLAPLESAERIRERVAERGEKRRCPPPSYASDDAGSSASSDEACGTTVQNVSAEITTPTPGSTLMASIVTFTWSTGSGVSEYWLEVGRTLGSDDIYSDSQGTTLSSAISGLPTD